MEERRGNVIDIFEGGAKAGSLRREEQDEAEADGIARDLTNGGPFDFHRRRLVLQVQQDLNVEPFRQGEARRGPGSQRSRGS